MKNRILCDFQPISISSYYFWDVQFNVEFSLGYLELDARGQKILIFATLIQTLKFIQLLVVIMHLHSQAF